MGKVLIVEDNELNMKLFNDLLTMQDHQVLLSRDGIGVVELVQQELPDLILMDIQINGGICGMDLIKSLKALADTQQIPIIAITAFAMRQDEIRISQSGCDMYLSKPVSIDDFFKAIEKFIPSPAKANLYDRNSISS